MARKSRKNIAVVEEAPAIKVWRAALYIRLSVEFNGKRGIPWRPSGRSWRRM